MLEEYGQERFIELVLNGIRHTCFACCSSNKEAMINNLIYRGNSLKRNEKGSENSDTSRTKTAHKSLSSSQTSRAKTNKSAQVNKGPKSKSLTMNTQPANKNQLKKRSESEALTRNIVRVPHPFMVTEIKDEPQDLHEYEESTLELHLSEDEPNVVGDSDEININDAIMVANALENFRQETRFRKEVSSQTSRQNCRKSNVEECIFVYMACLLYTSPSPRDS